MCGLSESEDLSRVIQPTPVPSNRRFAYGKTERGLHFTQPVNRPRACALSCVCHKKTRHEGIASKKFGSADSCLRGQKGHHGLSCFFWMFIGEKMTTAHAMGRDI